MDLVHRDNVTAACGCTSCVNFKEPQIHSVYHDRIVYFCSRSCKKEFEEDPEAFFDSDHFKIEFNILDHVEQRKRENLDKEEIDRIKASREELAKEDLLIYMNK